MAGPLKREVLRAFKNLHRARLTVFKGDGRMLQNSRIKINEEFKKNKAATDWAAVHDMIGYANAVATELRTCVVQAEEKSPGVYELHIRPETLKLDNKPFDPDAELPRAGKRTGGTAACSDETTPCCQQTTPCCRENRAPEVKMSTTK